MSLRILAMSDTHGDTGAIRGAMPMIRALAPHAIYHLGDVSEDIAWLRNKMEEIPVLGVRGNGDFNMREPLLRVERVEEVSLLLLHGHHHGAKSGLEQLRAAARQRDCQCVLFGHTHRPLVEKTPGLLLVNPGSLARPREGRKGTMAIVLVTGRNVEASVITV